MQIGVETGMLLDDFEKSMFAWWKRQEKIM